MLKNIVSRLVKRKRSIWAAIVLAIFLLVVMNFQLLTYGWMQLRGQLRVMNNARPIVSYLENPHFPDSLKSKILLIQEAKQFAIDSLGLESTDNYTSLYDQKGKPILWNVSACKPFSFEDKQWGFPIIGSFSYKGFFDLEKAEKLKRKLINKGWDVRLRTVGGWSTLGWFEDPILSNMLLRSEGRVVELIIHELTHATLFVKGDVTLNENLATFVGEHGALSFMMHKYGAESSELKVYANQEADYLKFSNHMLESAVRLDSLYNSFTDEDSFENKLAEKTEMMRKVVDELDNIGLAYPEKYRRIFKDSLPNNAYFSSYLRYRSKQKVFEEEYEALFGGDLPLYLSELKKRYPL